MITFDPEFGSDGIWKFYNMIYRSTHNERIKKVDVEVHFCCFKYRPEFPY